MRLAMNATLLKTIKTSFKISILWLCISSGTVLSQTLSLSPNLIGFNSDEGEKLLIDSKSREDFFP
jgi:hypothetical protein